MDHLQQISNGVYRIAFPNVSGEYFVNSYLFRLTTGDYVLIDAGWGTTKCYDIFVESLERSAIPISKIICTILTHAHPDHSGIAWELRRQFGTRIYMHENDLKLLRDRKEVDTYVRNAKIWLSSYLTREEIDSVIDESRIFRPQLTSGEPDETIDGSGKENLTLGHKNTLASVFTPGHSFGHIVLYSRERRILFTGDHLLPKQTPNISLSLYYDNDPLQDYLQSLKIVSELDVGLCLPGHGDSFGEPGVTIQFLLNHHLKRINNLLSILDRQMTVWEISRRLNWSPGQFLDFTSLQKRQAVTETLAHLRYLEKRGIVEVVQGEKCLEFRRSSSRNSK